MNHKSPPNARHAFTEGSEVPAEYIDNCQSGHYEYQKISCEETGQEKKNSLNDIAWLLSSRVRRRLSSMLPLVNGSLPSVVGHWARLHVGVTQGLVGRAAPSQH